MISDQDYNFFADLLRENSGLALGPGKEYLLQSRLLPVAESYGLNSLAELADELRSNINPRLPGAVSDAMTTNETSFYRDKTPFEDLKKTLIPKLIESNAGHRTIRIWSAANSTGQEPYSILMLIAEHFPQLLSWNIEMWGTDISQRVLDKAREGIYSQFEVQRGLAIQQVIRHFQQVDSGWQIQPQFRSALRLRRLNLLEPFSGLPVFDLIFCRNVLIYFEPDVKKDILSRLQQRLQPHGRLILGSAETVLGLSDAYERDPDCESTVYRAKGTRPSLTGSLNGSASAMP